VTTAVARRGRGGRRLVGNLKSRQRKQEGARLAAGASAGAFRLAAEAAMRKWWAWSSVIALCVSPALAEAQGRGRDRGERGGGQPSSERRSDRAERRHPSPRSRGSSDRPAQATRERSDSGPRYRARQENRSGRTEGRYSERGRSSRASRGNWDQGRREDRNRGGDRYRSDSRSRSNDRYRYDSRNRRDDRYRYDSRGRGSYGGYSYRSGPYRGWPSHRYRPRYPARYRNGYVHLHGYYYPRYYYEYGSYSAHASVRLLVEPSEAEVYVDGCYAGVVDDFDGIFQRLHLTPGTHEITLRLGGFQTWSAQVYAVPDRTVKLHHHMLPGASGLEYGPEYDESEQPPVDGEPGVYEGPDNE
jgi:hypothetical protein